MRFETPRARRRRAAVEAPFPAEWRQILDEDMVHWRWLDDAERVRLERLVAGFLFDKRFEWARGFTGSTEVEVLIAASACLLILGLEDAYFRDVGSIIVHPTGVVLEGRRPSPRVGGLETDAIVPILGQSSLHGPVVIAWDSAKRSAAHPHTGHNVVYHEFAHKIDMVDGSADGAPPMDPELRSEWERICSDEYEAIRDGTSEDPFLSSYAGVNRAEFFAVATEFFLDRPIEMLERKPALYGVLRGFYRQDPAAREHRFLGSSP